MSSSPTKSTVLVTGACGYIGSHVARMLSEQGYKVVVIDNLSTGFKDALIHGETLYQGDVGDAALQERVFTENKIAAILHFAAAIRVEESVADPVKYYSNNTVNTLKLLNAAVKYQVPRVIFSSTAATYGQPRKVPVDETAATIPESPYGWSKLMSEQMLRDIAAAHGIKNVILRYFNVAGADPLGRLGQRTPEASHLIKVACEVAVGKRQQMQVYGTDYATPDGTCVRDYIHVEDLANAHLLALEHLLGGGESSLLNCGYGHGSSVREVIAAVKKVSGKDFKVLDAPRRAGDVASIVANADKIRQTLLWKPRFDDLETIVKHAFAWEKKLRQL
ncbi:MAG: UDP-glucose 4-epimerase GalE [Proteobacteria bacterium]|nr:UDP-glucose 4-epimerase GalE [Pseudomonadota bacterium]